MLTMNDLVDLRMQQQLAHELYRQQIMQRIPDPFSSMLPLHMPHHIIVPPRPTLPGVEAKLENNELWKQFHKIGTEMIITKCGRRMFPSMRVSLSGLEEEANYCVLLEMVPIGDCRYKFSGSHWIPAGGAEPQSPQRMFLHPDSPATGAHWQSQAILFNKVKLTNNTLDSNGHIVLASMHKYQPRLHIIRTSDLSQLPWAPQQAFIFPETEYVAVTAYQNDRITKLKIDNNPFAKGFRETGQSRCKRKLSTQNEEQDSTAEQPASPHKSSASEDDRASVHSNSTYESSLPCAKRVRSHDSFDDDSCLNSNSSSCGSISPRFDEAIYSALSMYHRQQQQLFSSSHMDIAAANYLGAAPPMLMHLQPPAATHHHHHQHQHHQHLPLSATAAHMPLHVAATAPAHTAVSAVDLHSSLEATANTTTNSSLPASSSTTTSISTPSSTPTATTTTSVSSASPTTAAGQPTSSKRNNFSISAILAY